MAEGNDTSEHERLVAALKASRAGTWRWDIPADRVEWDEALSAVYGLPHIEAPRTSAQFFQLIHPDDRERAGRLLGVLLENGDEIEYEFRAIVGDRIVWIYDRSSVVVGGYNLAPGLLTALDFTFNGTTWNAGTAIVSPTESRAPRVPSVHGAQGTPHHSPRGSKFAITPSLCDAGAAVVTVRGRSVEWAGMLRR